MISFYLFFVLAKQISLKSDEYFRDSIVVENTQNLKDYTMKFDCPISEGSVKINLVCPDQTKCNALGNGEKFWFKVNFQNNAYLSREVQDTNVHGTIHLSAFVKEDRIRYDPNTYTLSYYVDSQNIVFADYEDSTLKCPAPSPTPKVHYGSVIENTQNGKDYTMRFNCPVSEGSVKINLVCPDQTKCNALGNGEKFWFKVNFQNNAYLSREVQDTNVHGTIHLSAFVKEDRIRYDPNTYTLSYYVDSQNIVFADYEDSTLKCPAPSPTPKVHYGSVIENTQNGKDYTMRFNCPISEGSVKINLVCPDQTKCNALGNGEKFWFKVNFQNNAYLSREVQDTNVHGTIHLSAFVKEDRIRYDPNTYTLSYYVDSQNIVFADCEDTFLVCPAPTSTPRPTEIHYALIVDNTQNGKDYTMKFDCPISEGSVKINLVCPDQTKCNALGNGEKFWFKVNFQNNAYLSREVQDTNVHSTIHLSAFVKEDRIRYDPNTYTLSYYVDSQNIVFADYEDSTLICAPEATPKATQTPSTSPEIIIIDSFNLTSDGRLVYEEKEQQRARVILELNNFTGIKSNVQYGGAVYTVNMGFQCTDSFFDGCSSTSAGGAIYLSNEYDHINFFTLENIQFKENEAKYGGGAYIYSKSKNNNVDIHYCTFINNVASSEITSDNLYGGSSLYLIARKMKVRNSHFESNSGYDIRIVNNFNEKTSSSKSFYFVKSSDKIIIADCNFEVSKNTLCSLFFVRGNNGVPYEINRCSFTGDLGHNAYYIDGQTVSNNSPKLIVKKCNFASNFKKALNLDPMNDFLSVDLNDQFFNVYDPDINEMKASISAWKIIVAVVVPAAAIAAIATVVVVMKKRKQNCKEDNEKESEFNGNLINDTLL